MYRDKVNTLLLKILLCAAFCALLLFAVNGFRLKAGSDLSDESAVSIKEAIERAALQCYVVEGAYPRNLDYLKENYGLNINERSYYVVYDAYAENQLPDIRIVRK